VYKRQQIDYRLLENLKLIGGLQANKVQDIDLNIVPRAGLIWYPADRFSIKALYSTAFRAPSINEVNMNFGTILKGNKNLKPENVSTVDLNFGYQGKQAQLGVNFFYSKMTDIIQVTYVAGTGIYNNTASVTYTGAEFEGKYYIDKNLYITGSVLYQTNKNDSDQKNFAPVANFGTKAGISYVTDNGITLGLFDIYQGDIDGKYTINRNPYQGSYNLLHFNSKFNLNKLFDMSFKPGLTLIFSVDNLFDKPHYGYDLGGTTGDGIPSIPGRAIYFGLNLGI
jgi:outer membrane receptor protein involved in Fe transport